MSSAAVVIGALRVNIKFRNNGTLNIFEKKIYNLESFYYFQDFDPLADHRRAKISDREDEYRARRRQMIISPERYDPFADGQYY